jgi:hypothetical protein
MPSSAFAQKDSVGNRKWFFDADVKAKRDFSLRMPTRSQEANVKEKTSACCARNDRLGVR